MENLIENSNDPKIIFAQQELPTTEKLKSIWQLMKESFSLYRSKFKTLIAIMILPIILAFFLQGMEIFSVSSQVLSQSLPFSIAKITLWLVSLYFGIINILAIAYSIKEENGAIQSYSKAIKNSFSYIVVVILMMLLVLAGFVLIFIPGELLNLYFSWTSSFLDSLGLLIRLIAIPAIILSIALYIYFVFSVFVFAFEEKKGFGAIWRSKRMVSGNFWKVLWRLFVFFFFICLIGSPIIFVEQIAGDKYQIIMSLTKLFFVPFAVVFGILLYKNLFEIKLTTVDENPKLLNKVAYYFSVAVVLPLVLVAFWLQILNLTAYDIPNPDDSNLQLQTLNVSKDKNAYYAFSETNEKVYWPTGQDDKLLNILAGKDWDDSIVNEILQKNQQTLGSLEKGVVLPVFQQPELQDPKNYNANLIITSLGSLRNLAKVNSIQTLSLLKQGKEKEAFDQSMKTVKMAQMVEDAQGSLIGYLVGLAIKGIALDNMRVLIVNSHLSSAELLGYVNELNQYKESKLSLRKAMKSEYIMAVNSKEKMIDPVFRGEKPSEENEILQDVPSVLTKSNFYYQPNRTKLLFMESYGELVANAEKNNYSEVNHAEKMPITPLIIFTNNAAGKIISNIISISFDSLFAKRFEENFSAKGTQLLLALKAYKQDNDNLPNSLNDLIPKYIPALIQDPFDGKTIRYSANDKIIYSVGKDLTDDGGNMGNTWSNGNDLVFKIDF